MHAYSKLFFFQAILNFTKKQPNQRVNEYQCVECKQVKVEFYVFKARSNALVRRKSRFYLRCCQENQNDYYLTL
jgi:hypothetical protein